MPFQRPFFPDRCLTPGILILVSSIMLAGCQPGRVTPSSTAVRPSSTPAAEEKITPSPSPSADAPPTSVPEPPLAERLAADLPARDRADLARRFLGWQGDWSVPAHEYRVGDVESFWISNADENLILSVEAQLLYVGEHVYIWIEQGQPFDLDAYVAAARRFDSHIYPTTRALFGSEPLPGVDGDPRLHILHSVALSPNMAGYFYSPSQYPASVVSYSNQKEMFFINISNISPTSDTYDSTLAHEFQHMIHWNVDSNEDIWLNEGLAELSSFVNGYGPSNFTFFFMGEPDLQLNTWPQGTRRPHYGAAFLFAAYWHDRFGDEAVQALVTDPLNGLNSVESALAAIGAPLSADEFFADWVVANLLNNPDVGDGRFAYPSLPTLPPPLYAAEVDEYPTLFEDASVHQYGTDYVYLAAPGHLTISFEGTQDVRIIPANTHDTDGDPATQDRFVWWSNRGDDADTTLTRGLDLRTVAAATLSYDVWFAIEDLWDYAYVTVSSDEGRTWTILSPPYATADNPNGTAYGSGYTGLSVDLPGANPEGWLHEEVDLTPYAGQEILLRFESITDDSVSLPGLAVDNICVTQIDWCDDAESNDGEWVAQGFVRHDNNVLPQNFILQLVTYDDSGAPAVERLALSADNTLNFDLAITRDTPAILIISGLTRHTTEVAFYRLEINRLEE